MQWLAFVQAYLFKIEKFFDQIGSITYLTVVAVAVLKVLSWMAGR